MYEVIKIILKRLFSFEDKALRKYASSCRRQTPVPHNKTVQDEYTAIIRLYLIGYSLIAKRNVAEK